MKDKGGRPSKYDSKYCQEIIKYFDIEPFRDVDIPHVGKTGEFKWMDLKRMANGFPTFLGFAKKIGVNGDTLVEWAKEENKKKYPGFSAAYTHAKELQKWILIENGLNGLYNAQFTIFVAKNITDMKDKQEFEGNINTVFNVTREQTNGENSQNKHVQSDSSTPRAKNSSRRSVKV